MTYSQKAIGIDLGTTYCRVAVWQNDRVEVIANDQGNTRTPSCVAFTNTTCLIGDTAKNQITKNPHNTIYNAKRLIGRLFADTEVQANMKRWPFKVLEEDSKPVIQVEYKGEEKRIAPVEVLSLILTKMRETAEAHLGESVEYAVITVPASFNQWQRQTIRDAGLIAGLKVLRLMMSPTAAVMAYPLNRKIDSEKCVLILDLGGGTFDVSLVVIENDICEVRAVAADGHLGGEDFNNRLVNYFIKEFKEKHNKDLTTNTRALVRLQIACERAKCALSSSKQTTIEIDSLFEGIDYYTTLTRTQFEDLCIDLFRSILEPIEKVLRDSKIDKGSIDEILFVGSSSRIPRIQKLIADFFHDKAPNQSINPDEAVVQGAAVHAAFLTGDSEGCLLLDVAPLSIGIETSEGTMMPILKRNTTVPTIKSDIISTNNEPNIVIKVLEGDRVRTEDNNFLGKLELTDIPPMPEADQNIQIEVTFNIDGDGILDASIREKTTGKRNKMTRNDKGYLSKEEIERMVNDARKYKDDHQKEKDRITARNSTEWYVYQLQGAFEESIKFQVRIDAGEKVKLEAAILETIDWLDHNETASKEEFEVRQRELQTIANPIIFKILRK